MGVLDEFKLYFEKLPSENRTWMRDTVLRVGGVTRHVSHLRLVRAGKSELARDIPTLRLFKRLYNVEAKLDKPFLYDSELLHRIEKLEATLAKRRRYERQK